MAAQTGIAGNKTPAPVATQTGISGNNTGQIGQATAARTKAHDKSVYFHAAVALMLIVLGITLAGQKLSFFWKLVVGISLIIVGGKLAGVKGYDKYRGAWPQIIRGLGSVVVVTTVLMSGIGNWTSNVAEGIDTAAFCAVESNKTDQRCIAKAMQEEAEANAKAAAAAASRARYENRTPAAPAAMNVFSIQDFCNDGRECGHVPAKGEVQVAVLEMRPGHCLVHEYRPKRAVEKVRDEGNGKITFTIPPRTNFRWTYIKPGEVYRGEGCPDPF